MRFHWLSLPLLVVSAALWPTNASGQSKDARTLKGHAAPVTAVAYSSDGLTIASASVDSTIKTWNAETGQLIATLKGHDRGVLCIAFSPQGGLLASGGDDGFVRLWEASTGTLLTKLSDNPSKLRCLAFSPNGERLAVGREDSTIELWNVKDGTRAATFKGHKRAVLSLAFTSTGGILASGSADESVKLWSLARRAEMTPDELKRRGQHGAIRSLTFSPNGVELAMTTNDFVAIWEFSQLERRFVLPRRRQGVIWMARYSPRGRLLAAACGADLSDDARGKSKKGSASKGRPARANEIRLWDSATGKECGHLNGHTGPVRAISFSPDGGQLVSGSDDATVRLWNVGGYQEFGGSTVLDALTASTANASPSPVADSEPPADVIDTSDDDDGPTAFLELDGSVTLTLNRSKVSNRKSKEIRGLPARPTSDSGNATVFQYRAARGVSGLGGGHTVGSGGGGGGGGGGGKSSEGKGKKHE